MSKAIYLDGFATLPVSPVAKAALIDALSETGNAASPHGAGAVAARLVEQARAAVAQLIGASPGEIVFTSGATEANNLTLLGVARALRDELPERRRLIVSAIEHKSVIGPAHALSGEGFEVVTAPVDDYGRLDLDAYAALLNPETLLVSVMTANNETGVIQPVAEAATLAHDAGALFHSDAAQAAGKIPLDVNALGVDYLSVSAHKCYGPMGVGALYVAASKASPRPLQFGGGQQGALRPGTEPVALIAGFGAAAAEAKSRLDEDGARASRLANQLFDELAARQVRLRRITGSHPVVPGSLALALEDCEAEDLCLRLARQVHLSTGSACTSGQLRASHVLEAMRFSEKSARHVLRAFCHRYLADEEVSVAAVRIAAVVSAHSRLATGEVLQ
jgi:cysteine desulfurase